MKIDNSILTDIFSGQLMNRVLCKKCNYESYAFDNFMDLSVEVPDSSMTKSLSSCLKQYFKVENLKGTGYKCDGCKKKVNIEKSLSLYRLPNVLVIHLKRFKHEGYSGTKITTSVSFAE
mmetsp:Transcript_35204/g.25673  ORF Transcript_35204/g.25673 Transcript_35204/m.25673 type:complete len:119 (-) Transcript_35204:240-596(-)